MTILFVHGNLRPGQPDFWRLERYTADIHTVTLTGYRLYNDNNEALLLVTGNPQDTVTGELITLEENTPEQLVKALDKLMMTERGQNPELLTVHSEPGSAFNAWAYIIDTPRGDHVPSGDWNTVAN